MAAGEGVEIIGPAGDRFEEILTPDALHLVGTLQREFGGKRAELLAARAARQEELSAGGTLDFLPETRAPSTSTCFSSRCQPRGRTTIGASSPSGRSR